MNSLNEMEELARYCRDGGVKALVVVSAPYHIPRSFLSALSVASRLHPDLLVYASGPFGVHQGGEGARSWRTARGRSSGLGTGSWPSRRRGYGGIPMPAI
jgi:hypothetical protein